jgi:hypothetical protein
MSSACVAVVHVDGEGHWLRVTEPHTPARRQELRRYAAAFDDGYYAAAAVAETFGVTLPGGRNSAAPYVPLREFILNYTDDEILAARVALDLCGPARASIWEDA